MKKRKKDLLELRDALIEEARVHGPNTPEHTNALAQIALLEEVLDSRKQPWISPDTIVSSAVAVGMTVLVLLFERNHAVTGKAFTFLRTPKT